LLNVKLPTRFETKSRCFGVTSVAIGAWSVTSLSIFTHWTFAASSFRTAVLRAACIWSLIGLSHQPEKLMLESLPGWNDSQPNRM
jgi:hypothetical protein